MSVDNVKAFFEKAKTDEALKAKLKALADKCEAQQEAAVSELIRLATEAGHAFTAKHLQAHQDSQVDALTDDQLKSIAGGAFPTSVNSQITDSVTQA